MATSTSVAIQPTDVLEALDSAGAKASSIEGISLKTFFASLAVAAAHSLLEGRSIVGRPTLTHAHSKPRTYLVPDKERTTAPPTGLLTWLIPLFSTTRSDFIEKSGLDAYFFLRFLRTLLKIFIVLAVVILPILLPINAVGGRGADFAQRGGPQYNNVTGLDQLAFGNVRPTHTRRYWAHLVCAVFVVVVVCYVFFDELRYYVRIRQRYLMTPQHRLRASATTVLITGIPSKFCSVKALEELFDIFPGGVRNIWINRDFDELAEKIEIRDAINGRLEEAETRLIQKCKRAHMKRVAAEAKKRGQRPTKKEKTEQQLREDIEGTLLAYQGDGAAAGNPHQVKHTVFEATHDASGRSLARARRPWLPVPALGQGMGLVGQRVNQLGRTVRRGLPAWRSGQPHPATMDGPNDESIELTRLEASEASTAVDSLPSETAQDHVPGDPSSSTAAAAHEKAHDASRGPSPDVAASTTHDAHDVEPPRLERRNTGDGVPPAKRPMRLLFWRRDPSTIDLEVGQKKKSSKKPGAPDDCSCGTHQRFKTPFDTRFEKDGGKTAFRDQPVWKKYISDKDREMLRIWPWSHDWPSKVPFVGRKVDAIRHYRDLLAELTAEIEHDQRHPETYPLMNSAFVQFNNQLAAHMAAQSLTHHMPKQMAPRMVEIHPQDVIWGNMSLTWMGYFIRRTVAWFLVACLVVGWAFPVTFTGLLSQIKSLTLLLPWLDWINDLPVVVIGLVQGVLPQVLLAILMAILPVILRLIALRQGCVTGNAIELTVQNYYFIFLFVQIFLIVSISSGITTALRQLLRSVGSAPAILAINLPRASNYFFSYMLLQAFSVSAGALLQIPSLFYHYVWGPLTDKTPRARWLRQVGVPTMAWGSFFPVYTNLAAIGLIYSVVSPLILVFNIITFAMFWVAYRYNTLFVTRFRFDTGGLMYPRAINQLFVGLYVMELCLIGLFFLVRDENEEVACQSQAVIMIIVTILTALYQKVLHDTFSPLFKFLPVTLEDEAALRDKEFQAQKQRERLEKEKAEEAGDQDISIEDRQRRREERRAKGIEFQTEKAYEMQLNPGKKHRHFRKNDSDEKHQPDPAPRTVTAPGVKPNNFPFGIPAHAATSTLLSLKKQLDHINKDEIKIGQALFAGLNNQLEDLNEDDRDWLVREAFMHEALRAKRPVCWIPRDNLGVSEDEIRQTEKHSPFIWISNEFTGLDSKCKPVYKKGPPDYSELDMIDL
ncbi:MAG: Kynureninase (L-kynurenine hydrolase) [Watsoniomyces obsoletus]|nr:MAG: Kynureninase (L-kynurenine hydrolase) [Watsoniomyces obsoletus]